MTSREYLFVKEELREAERALERAEQEVSIQRHRVGSLRNLLQKLAAFVCKTCDGKGQVPSRVAEARHDPWPPKHVCDDCDGSGTKKGGA